MVTGKGRGRFALNEQTKRQLMAEANDTPGGSDLNPSWGDGIKRNASSAFHSVHRLAWGLVHLPPPRSHVGRLRHA
jgi:hypothetical protein